MVLPIVIAVIAIAGYFFTQSKSTARMAVKQVESNERINKLKKEIKSKEEKGREELKKNISTVKKYQKKSKEKSSKDTKPKLTNKELKEKLSKVLQFHKKSNQFQKDGKYAYFHMGRLDSSTWFRFGKITKSGNVIFYDYENQKEIKKVGKVSSSVQRDNKLSWKIGLYFSGYAYFLNLD